MARMAALMANAKILSIKLTFATWLPTLIDCLGFICGAFSIMKRDTQKVLSSHDSTGDDANALP